MICRLNFEMSFGILIFDTKRAFCMGYSPSMMADYFQNGLIFRIFCVFFERFFSQNNSK